MGYATALMLMAVLFLLFTVPTQALDTGQVIKEQVVTVHPTAAAPTENKDPIRPVVLNEKSWITA